MTETKLITLSDFAEYRHITANINEVARLDPFIIEAQLMDLKPVLGSYLYDDFIKNISQSKYTELLNGKEYTNTDGKLIRYHGVKPVLVYYTYARLLANDNYRSTPTGFVKKLNDYSEHIDSGSNEKTLNRLITQARSSAISYQQEMIDFLNEYDTIYDLWNYSTSGTSPLNMSGCKISSIP
jgi:hypothetical protein